MDLNFNGRQLPQNPIELFESWYIEYQRTSPKEPSAMFVATCDSRGCPSVRTVLLKSYDESGLVFFTNYESHKGKDLNENPKAEVLFYWESLGRQVRVYGEVEKLTAKESDDYFVTRPYLSQIGAWASTQSHVIPDRATLEKKVEELKKKFSSGAVPRPPHWGGFRVKSERIEFWVGKENRLHDRFKYELSAGQWEISRLSP